MASKDQNVMLLQEVVGQLRKLNASSVRDRLREAEEAKRAEKIAMQGDVQEETQSSIVDSTEDFRRRFIAGQAKTFVDTNITKTAEGKKNSERNRLLKNISTTLGAESGELAGEETTEINTGLIKVNSDALVQTLSTIKNINKQMLDFMKLSRKEDDLRYNAQQRAQEEARREAINLNRSSLSGGGMGASPDLSGLDGGIGFGEVVGASMLGTAAGGAGLGLLASMKKWFGFGTKRSFLKTMKLRFKIAGRKIFRKFKLTGAQTKMLSNPRKWPIILASVLAASFLGLAAADDSEEEASLTSDVLPPDDGVELPEQGVFSKSIDNMFVMAGTAALLSRSTIIQNVSKQVGAKLQKAYSSAPKNSLRGRLYANAGFKRGLSLTGRGLLRFMGPWGFGAWVAWELGNWAMKSYATNEEEAEAALDQMINDVAADTTDLIGPNSNDELARLLAPDRNNGAFSSADRKNKAISKIKELMKTKNASQRKKLIQQLGFLGWNVDELTGILNSAGVSDVLSRDRDGDLFSNLKMEEKERDKIISLGAGGTRGPSTLITGNQGDTIYNNHTYIQGSQLHSVFEGVTSDMLAYP